MLRRIVRISYLKTNGRVIAHILERWKAIVKEVAYAHGASRGFTSVHPSSAKVMRRSSSTLTSDLRSHLNNIQQQHAAITERLSHPEELTTEEYRKLSKLLASLSPLVQLIKAKNKKMKEMDELSELIMEGGELGRMAEGEKKSCMQELKKLEDNILVALIPKDEADENDAILEVRAGSGGQEASLFSSEMLTMYQKFASYKKWKFDILEISRSDSGGYKEASASITGHGVFGKMKFEVGVHRVQRVPTTEAQGRIHTSTMTVAVLPQPQEVDVIISASELKIDTFRASGAGGQHVNTTDSAVRITHLPTGLVVNAQEERSQFKNKAKAMQVLRARLYEMQRQQAASERDQARRLQIGTAGRSEKIRTYNFPQGRVTDHRIAVTCHDVERFLEGGAILEGMIDALRAQDEQRALQDVVDQYKTKS